MNSRTTEFTKAPPNHPRPQPLPQRQIHISQPDHIEEIVLVKTEPRDLPPTPELPQTAPAEDLFPPNPDDDETPANQEES